MSSRRGVKCLSIVNTFVNLYASILTFNTQVFAVYIKAYVYCMYGDDIWGKC